MFKYGAFGLFSLLVLAGCSDPKIDFVKNGVMDFCPDKTVGEMVSDFMGSPDWESGVTDNGTEYVNIHGDITVFDKGPLAGLQ